MKKIFLLLTFIPFFSCQAQLIHFRLSNTDAITRAQIGAQIAATGSRIITNDKSIQHLNNSIKNLEHYIDRNYRLNAGEKSFNKRQLFVIVSSSTKIAIQAFLGTNSKLPYMTKRKRNYINRRSNTSNILAPLISTKFKNNSNITSDNRYEFYRTKKEISKLLNNYDSKLMSKISMMALGLLVFYGADYIATLSKSFDNISDYNLIELTNDSLQDLSSALDLPAINPNYVNQLQNILNLNPNINLNELTFDNLNNLIQNMNNLYKSDLVSGFNKY
ncbi:MAG: hypothetical protein QMC35_05850 [Polaribacter sp.]|jgi:hypothetical protein